ncbi:hypothetical protein LPJ67_005977 [Coemansia sp. RSA 1938]|nr:hypothetical protein LPJ67_005977 [Coemansia sp. RSA 1938]
MDLPVALVLVLSALCSLAGLVVDCGVGSDEWSLSLAGLVSTDDSAEVDVCFEYNSGDPDVCSDGASEDADVCSGNVEVCSEDSSGEAGLCSGNASGDADGCSDDAELCSGDAEVCSDIASGDAELWSEDDSEDAEVCSENASGDVEVCSDGASDAECGGVGNDANGAVGDQEDVDDVECTSLDNVLGSSKSDFGPLHSGPTRFSAPTNSP